MEYHEMHANVCMSLMTLINHLMRYPWRRSHFIFPWVTHDGIFSPFMSASDGLFTNLTVWHTYFNTKTLCLVVMYNEKS